MLPVESMNRPTEFSVIAVLLAIIDLLSKNFPLNRDWKTAELSAVFSIKYHVVLVTVDESDIYKQAASCA